MYVLDTSSISQFKHFYPDIFGSFWDGINELVKNGQLISTKEVKRELGNGAPNPFVDKWIKDNSSIFTTPSTDELGFVAEIFKIEHFQMLIAEKQRLKGDPVADPFVIACAKLQHGIVVTEEARKENAAKIPNVCEHFNINCITLRGLMQEQGWNF